LVRYGADVNSMSDTGSTPGMKDTIIMIYKHPSYFQFGPLAS